MTVPTILRAAIGELVPLGHGGTAKVYRCPDLRLAGFCELAYKEYKPKIRALAGPALLPGLVSLVQFREGLDQAKRDQWDAKMTWPLRVVIDGGDAVGILMRIIPQEYFVMLRRWSGAAASDPAEVNLLLDGDDDMAQRGLSPVSMAARLRICAQIVGTYALAHQRGVIAGDLSARNLVYQHNSKAVRVLLVDCDSSRVRGARSPFGHQPHTPGWEAPENLLAAGQLKALQRDPNASKSELDGLARKSMAQSVETDVYKVGLLVTRVLDHGRQRSRNRSGAGAAAILGRHTSRELAGMLERALDPVPANRPRLIDWYQVWRGPRAGRPVSNSSDPAAAQQPSSGGPVMPRTSGSWTWIDGVGWARGDGRAESSVS